MNSTLGEVFNMLNTTPALVFKQLFEHLLNVNPKPLVFGGGEDVLAQRSPPGEAMERSKLSDSGTQGTCVDAAIASNSFYSAAVRRR